MYCELLCYICLIINLNITDMAKKIIKTEPSTKPLIKEPVKKTILEPLLKPILPEKPTKNPLNK